MAQPNRTVHLAANPLPSAVQLRWPDKDPGDTVPCTLDATRYLDPGDAILPGFTMVVTPGTTPAVTAIVLAATDTAITWQFSGGSVASPIIDYQCQLTFTTAFGLVVNRTIWLRVRPLSVNLGYNGAGSAVQIVLMGGGVQGVTAFGADATGATDSAPAFQAAYNALPETGGEIMVPQGDFALASAIVWSGKPVSVRGAGKGISRLHIQHSGIGFDIAPGALTNRVQLRDFSAFAENTSGPTAAVARVTYATTASWGYVTTVIENVECFGYPNGANGTAPFPQTFTRGFILNGCWSSQVGNVSFFGPPAAAGATSAAMLELCNSNDTRILSPQAYYGHALVVQTGYCEGVYIINPVVVGPDFAFVQTAQTGWVGYSAGKTSLLGLWIHAGELNTQLGTVQAAALTLGSVVGCDVSRDTGPSTAQVLFDFTDVSNFDISGCNFVGGPGGIDVAIRYQATFNSSGNSIRGGHWQNMATAVHIVGAAGTVALEAHGLNAATLPVASAFIDESAASNGNRLTFRVPATASQPAGTGSVKDHILAGPDGSAGLRVKAVQGGTDYLTVQPASPGGVAQVTLGSTNGGLVLSAAYTLWLQSANGSPVIVGGNPAFAGVSTVGALRALPYAGLQDGHVAFVGNYGSNTTPTGGGTFKWNAASTAAHDGIMVIAPTGITGAGRWLRAVDERQAINVQWCGAVSSDTVDCTAAFTAARTLANARGWPIYVPPGRYKLAWTIADAADLWLVGEGTLLWSSGAQAAGTVLNVVRPIGAPIAISGLAQAMFGYVDGNAYVDSDATNWVLQGISGAALPGISAGQIYHLNSQDNFPWSPIGPISVDGTAEAVWQGQLVRVQGIGVPFTGATTALVEDVTVTGATSGVSAIARSVTNAPGGTTGYMVFVSLPGAFTVGENILVGGVVAGVVSGAAVVAIAEQIYDTFTTSPQIQLLTPCKTVIDGLAFDVPAGSNVEAVIGTVNRWPGIILGNCIEPVVRNVTAISGWTRFLQSCGCWMGDYDVRIHYLPDDANPAEGAYGYGVELGGPDTGSRVRVIATSCRHAFTTDVYWGGYAYMAPHVRGNPRDFLVYGSTARDTYCEGFDTHWGCYGGRFEDCRADFGTALGRNVSGSAGFQNRGFNTSYIGCVSTGAANGFVDAYSYEGVPTPPAAAPPFYSVTHYDNCHAIDYQENGFAQTCINPGSAQNAQEYRGCTARGDGRVVNGPYYQRGFLLDTTPYAKLVSCAASRFNGAPFESSGFGARIELFDFEADYRDCPSSASGAKFDNLSGETAPIPVVVSGYRVYSNLATSSPASIFRNGDASGVLAIAVSGFVGSLNRPQTPLCDAGTVLYPMDTRVTLPGQAAAGTNAATATPITAQVTVFTTVAAGTGCVLPDISATSTGAVGVGGEKVVMNRGANALAIYPAPGQAIEAGAAGASISVAAGSTARLTPDGSGVWRLG